MNRYSTIVFDVGGTLLRFNLDALARAYITAGAARGIALDFARTRAVVETLERELPARTRQRLISLEQDNGKNFWDDFYAEGYRRLGARGDISKAAAEIRERFQRAEFESLYDDVVPALDALASRGYMLGILSNFSANLEDVLRQVGVHHYFSFFVVSAIAGVEKPDARIFDLTVRAANRARVEIVYIGDSIFHDIEGAQRAGVAAVLLDRRNEHREFRGARVQNLRQLITLFEKESNANSI
jgi:putative hydrolase of the HAD superfamily